MEVNVEHLVMHVANGVSDEDYSYVTSCLALLQQDCSHPPTLHMVSWHGPDVTTASGRPLTVDCGWPDAPVAETAVVLPSGPHWESPDAHAISHIDQVLAHGGFVIAHDQASAWATRTYPHLPAGLISCSANDPCSLAVHSATALGTFEPRSVSNWATRFGRAETVDLANARVTPEPLAPVIRLATG